MTEPRRCSLCDCFLRTTNKSDVCSPCREAARKPVKLVPAEVLFSPTKREIAEVRRARILRLLAAEEMTAWSLSSVIGCTQRTARADLDLLEAEGKVREVRRDGMRRLYRAVPQDEAAAA